MSAEAPIGFFGKLPSAGDFVQRRLPASFVERWDLHFEQAVAASKTLLGANWPQAYRSSPVWRFVLGAQVCGPTAWAGVIGPGVDRVGRCFPMVIACGLAADVQAPLRALGRDAWFSAAADLLRQVQNDPGCSVELFDGQLAALGTVEQADCAADSAADGIDWRQSSQWRLPASALIHSQSLARLWAEIDNGSRCLWWTTGGGKVEPGVAVTAGLPLAYAGFLDGERSEGWSTPRATGGAPPRRAATASAPVPAAATRSFDDGDATEPKAILGAAPVPVPVPLPEDLDLGFDFDDAEGTALAAAAVERPAAGVETVEPGFLPLRHETAASEPSAAPVPGGAPGGAGFGAALQRRDCPLSMVVAESDGAGAGSVGRAALEIAHHLRTAELMAGVPPLRNRLLGLHAALKERAGSSPVECAVAAVHLSAGRASLLRIGNASAWLWRRGRLKPLFLLGANAVGADTADGADDLDDLLFAAPPAGEAGIGAAGVPAWDEVTEPTIAGDRLLLMASTRLISLTPELLQRCIGMTSGAQAAQRLAVAAHLGNDPRSWPLVLIEVAA